MEVSDDDMNAMARVLLAAPPPVTTRDQLAADPRVARWRRGAFEASLARAIELGFVAEQSDGVLLVNDDDACRQHLMTPPPLPSDPVERWSYLERYHHNVPSGLSINDIPNEVLSRYVNPLRAALGRKPLAHLPEGVRQQSRRHPLSLALELPLSYSPGPGGDRYPVGAPDPPTGVLQVLAPRSAVDAVWETFWGYELQRGATREDLLDACVGPPGILGRLFGRADDHVPTPALLRTFWVWFDTGYLPEFDARGG